MGHLTTPKESVVADHLLWFYGVGMTSGSTAASKLGYSPTIICGSNAEGEAIPPYFQLKTLATSSKRERFSIEFIAKCKDDWGTFGRKKPTLLPCTFGLNNKAGMNSVELDKYFKGSMLPLYPNIEDVPPLKRVIAKLDSGPGRMNLDMISFRSQRSLHCAGTSKHNRENSRNRSKLWPLQRPLP